MSDTERALLDAVCECPDDDVSRLIYADYLDERGEGDDRERAEFIRVQCQYPKCFDMTCECPHNPNGFRTGITCPDPVRKTWEYVRDGLSDYGDTIPAVYINTRNYRGAEVTILRGWPDHVTLTTEQLMGSDCSCRLSYEVGTAISAGQPEPVYDVTWTIRGQCDPCCTTCHGTGRTEGLARRLGAWPITKITLLGCEPHEDEMGIFWFREGDDPPMNADLPAKLFDLITTDELSQAGVGRFLKGPFPTRDAALSALSLAAVNLTRAAAGRGPLPTERMVRA